MVFPIAGGNESKGYEISNSLRFNNDDSPKLTFTPSSAGNRRTFTLSVWFKLQVGTTERVLLAADDGTGGNNNFDYIAIHQASKILVYGYEGSENQQLLSTQVLRDPSAWYHLVVAFDTTQGTAANRIKVYLNGSQITAFDTANYPSENFQTRFNNNNAQRISSYPDQDASYFDGYMAEYHLIDGSAKAPTDFGEFDNNGVWIPKAYDGTYGTNGFYLEFKETGTSQNSSGIGADTSGNDHHWAVTNLAATDVTTDTPTNNFAVGNVLSGFGATASDMTEGNLILDADSSGDILAPSTIGFSSGKWYMEIKSTITAGHGNRKTVGIYSPEVFINNPRAFDGSYSYTGVAVDLRVGDVWRNASDTGVNISTFANNDICSLAYDADNGSLYIYKNGTIENSGNPVNSSAIDTSKTYLFYLNQDGGSSNNGELLLNFGNPPTGFAISSGNADANGYGNFEYAVPSGYYSLCTKNLAEFG